MWSFPSQPILGKRPRALGPTLSRPEETQFGIPSVAGQQKGGCRAGAGSPLGGGLVEGLHASPCPQGERATGFGVALLLALFGRASEDPLLNLVSPLGCEEDAQEADAERDSKRRRLV